MQRAKRRPWVLLDVPPHLGHARAMKDVPPAVPPRWSVEEPDARLEALRLRHVIDARTSRRRVHAWVRAATTARDRGEPPPEFDRP